MTTRRTGQPRAMRLAGHPDPITEGPPMTSTTDPQALRDRIAEALIAWTYRGKDPEHGGILETVRANAYSRADAVLAVLQTATLRELELLHRPNTTPSRPEPRRVAAEEQPAETQACGRTKSVAGTEHPPCARPAGHEEAYCRSADGRKHFLAVGGARPAPAERPVVGEQPDTQTREA